jgi:UDP-N-acetylglucosamine 2-epimerase
VKRVLVVAGTRPEVIKLAPVVRSLRERPLDFETIYCSTGQHREMLDQANEVFQLTPDLDLGLMVHAQTLAGLTSTLFRSLDETLESTRPDAVVVQGDTTSAFVGAMCGFYRRITVGHVEAGLRTGNMASPFPEEANRSIIGRVATQHYAPTSWAADNLLREGIDPRSVVVTGNTIVDALHWARENARIDPAGEVPAAVVSQVESHRMILVTSHRRESFGQGMRDTFTALKRLVDEFPDTVVVYPVHLNPAVQEAVQETLKGHPRIHLLTPVAYPTMIWLLSRAYLVLSDSGGIQEEAPSFSKPLLVLRDTTERPEAVEAGCARLVGTDTELIVREASTLLSDRGEYDAMCGKPNPFGDGHAAQRITDALAQL